MSTSYYPLHSESQQTEKLHFYYLAVWLIYLMLSPIYVFSKGLPQPADIIIMTGVLPALGIAFLSHRKTIPTVYIYGWMFALLTFAVNWVNFSFYPHYRFPFASIYYVYNFLIFMYVVYLFRTNPERVRQLSYMALVIAIIVQFVWGAVFPDVGYRRVTAGFINPNQLAYWALLSSIMLAMMKGKHKYTWLDLMLWGFLGYLQTLALSKAGIICYLLFVFTVIFTPNMDRIARYITFCAFGLLLLYSVFELHKVTEYFNQVERISIAADRLSTIGQENDDSAEGRGYLRIVHYPEYVFFGAGEGAFGRFGEPRELHSGIATLIFSYGVGGTLLFFTFVGAVFNRLPWYYFAYIFIIILYGLTHQNIRFTHFWVFLGMAYAAHYYHIVPSRPAETLRKFTKIR